MREDFENRFKERWEERKQRWNERMDSRSRHGHIWTGVFILILGLGALIKASVTDLPDWLFSWQSFLILLGFFVGVKHGFRGGTWFILMLIGAASLSTEIYPDLNIRRYIWPVALITVGAFLIIRPRRRHYWQGQESEKKKTSLTGDPVKNDPSVVNETYESQKDYQEDFVDSTSVFGGAKKNIISKNFKGGDLVNIFGGTELDLTRADFTGTAVIELTTIFGGTKLIVPSNWTVKSEAVTIFGGMEDKRNMQTITDNPEKILLIKGTVFFGGIEIKSF
ncbi:MAG: LiaF domain-containing protein [Bacteroidota bacterium]